MVHFFSTNVNYTSVAALNCFFSALVSALEHMLFHSIKMCHSLRFCSKNVSPRKLEEDRCPERLSDICDKPSNPSLTTNLSGAIGGFWLTELRGEGSKLGEGERQ